MLTAISCRGTGEALGGPDNMLAYLNRLLDPSKVIVGVDVPYPASVGPANSAGNPLGPSEEGSIQDGLSLVAEAIRATPNLVLLEGYSLGAELVSRFLEAQAQGQYADCQLAGAVLIANPCRAPGESVDAGSSGEGINGAHGPWPKGLPIWTAANPLDGITSCPPRSPLRDIAAGMSAFSFASLGGWTIDLAHRLIDDDWPTADYTPAQLLEAGQLMYGYLLGGQHFTTYLEGGYLERVAAAVNAAF